MTSLKESVRKIGIHSPDYPVDGDDWADVYIMELERYMRLTQNRRFDYDAAWRDATSELLKFMKGEEK
jgi:hypothetical protein